MKGLLFIVPYPYAHVQLSFPHGGLDGGSFLPSQRSSRKANMKFGADGSDVPSGA